MHKTWRVSDLVIIVLLGFLVLMTFLQMSQADRHHRILTALLEQGGRGGAPIAAQPTDKQGDWLIRHFSSDPRTLNPIISKDNAASRVHDYVFDTLIDIDYDTLAWVPKMAESWTISDDKLTITFKLREGMLWSDGVPITTDDAVFSYETMMDPKVEAMQSRVYFGDVESVKALDDRTLEFKFKKRYYKSLDVAGTMTIIPRHVYQYTDGQEFNRVRTKLVGSGPYVFERWEPGQRIILRRNPYYWGEPGNFDKVVFKTVSDNTAALQSVKAQQIDLMGLTAEQFVQVESDEKFNANYKRLVYTSPRGVYSYIGWNHLNPLFQDKRVRRALTHLVPRHRINEEILHGLADIATGPFWPGSDEHDLPLQADNTVKPWPFDSGQALALLAEAGWQDSDGDGVLDKDGRSFTFQLLVPQGSQAGLDIASIAKEEMGKVGVKAEVTQLEWSVFQNKMDDRKYDAVLLAWVSNSVEGDPYQVWHSSSRLKKGSNHISFNNSETDRLIEEARMEFDTTKRNEIYHKFHRLLHEEQPYTFLFRSKARVAVHKRFEGVVIHPFGLKPLEWWTPEAKRLYLK